MKQAANFYKGVKTVNQGLTPGVRVWTNGFPLKMDPYKTCNNCIYCFARSTGSGAVKRNGIIYDPHILRVANRSEYLGEFKRSANPTGWSDWAIANRYFIELGTVGEAFQEIDTRIRATYNFIQLCAQFKIPLVINTKGNLLVNDGEYFDLIAGYPAPILMNVSLTTHIDDIARKIEPHCPPPTERLKLITKLRKVGIPSVLYLAPYMVHYTDKDIPGMMQAIAEAGAVSIHFRNLFITGNLGAMPYWKNYFASCPKGSVVRYGIGWAFSHDHILEVWAKMSESVHKHDKSIEVVGPKSEWFDLGMNHGRVSFERLPQAFKDGIIDFCAIPILRKIREKSDEPQLLTWSRMGFKEGMINTPKQVPLSCHRDSNHFAAGMHRYSGRDCRRIGHLWVDGFRWIKDAIWSGVAKETPTGYISEQSRIYKVMDRTRFAKDKDGEYVYAYIPKGREIEFVGSDGAVSLSAAAKFIWPKRNGGTEDKFGPPMKQIALGEDWRKK